MVWALIGFNKHTQLITFLSCHPKMIEDQSALVGRWNQ